MNLPAVRGYVRRLERALRLGGGDFNVCFVNDWEIQGLNAAYRGKSRPTDVLAFPWQEVGAASGPREGGALPYRDFAGFLGDIVISVETAQRNARAEGHSTENEIRWLILHGLLHLLGYDHEADRGEMTALELSLRAQLGIAN